VRVSLELIKPVALALCMISLCAVFQVVFLAPDLDVEQRCWQALMLLSLSAGISISSGMIFLGHEARGIGGCFRTLPVQIFCWAVGTMLVMFVAALYLETHCIFLKDTHRL
jgi:hypothetical protein